MSDIIVTSGVNRIFKVGNNNIDALKNINISIEDSKLTILKGRSGSGKTTLINMLGALDTPTSGKIIFEGEDIVQFSESKRDELRRTRMGYVFQSVALISLMSAYENVEFSLRVAGYSSKERRNRAVECLQAVGLEKRMKHMVHELSGGEQQRVAIARALAHRPKIIFADEPTAELDTQMAGHIVDIFKELVEKGETTIVMTTHDPKLTSLAHKVYTLEDGEVIDEQ
jgi:putative ABC transport system ATP-binding protein